MAPRPAAAAGEICVGAAGNPANPLDVASGFIAIGDAVMPAEVAADCCAAVAALDSEGRATVAATVAENARLILEPNTPEAQARAKKITEAALSCSHEGFVTLYTIALQNDPPGCWLGGFCPFGGSLLGFNGDAGGFSNRGGGGHADLPTLH